MSAITLPELPLSAFVRFASAFGASSKLSKSEPITTCAGRYASPAFE